MNCEILLQSCKAFLTSLKGASEKFCDMCGEYLADSSSEMETPSPSQGHLSMHLFHPSPSKIPSSSSTLLGQLDWVSLPFLLVPVNMTLLFPDPWPASRPHDLLSYPRSCWIHQASCRPLDILLVHLIPWSGMRFHGRLSHSWNSGWGPLAPHGYKAAG